jgi:hypothetical protein
MDPSEAQSGPGGRCSRNSDAFPLFLALMISLLYDTTPSPIVYLDPASKDDASQGVHGIYNQNQPFIADMRETCRMHDPPQLAGASSPLFVLRTHPVSDRMAEAREGVPWRWVCESPDSAYPQRSLFRDNRHTTPRRAGVAMACSSASPTTASPPHGRRNPWTYAC